MVQTEVEDLVVRLEESLELSSMEHGINLVGMALTTKPLNKFVGRGG